VRQDIVGGGKDINISLLWFKLLMKSMNLK